MKDLNREHSPSNITTRAKWLKGRYGGTSSILVHIGIASAMGIRIHWSADTAHALGRWFQFVKMLRTTSGCLRLWKSWVFPFVAFMTAMSLPKETLAQTNKNLDARCNHEGERRQTGVRLLWGNEPLLHPHIYVALRRLQCGCVRLQQLGFPRQ